MSEPFEEPAARERDRPSFESVYRQGARYVWRLLRRLGVPERHCEDALQDVFVVVNRLLPEYEPRDRLLGWLTKITIKVASTHRRRDRREPIMDIEETADPASERSRQAREDRELVLLLLDEIEHDRRTVLILHDIDEMSAPEIAGLLEIPVGTVRTRLRLARQEFCPAASRSRRGRPRRR